ncbi:MAG: methylated-DNA--[protein]-cysteine S-methyltransferase [Pseudomonadota bacterium]
MYARDFALIATPVGTIRLEGGDLALESVTILPERCGPRAGSAAVTRMATEQIEQWFAGVRTDFTVPLAASATPRGRALRNGIIAIGYGDTASYGALARQLGSSARAVGQACARNRFPILVPCHRILGAGGLLGAYSAGDGPATKQWLLDHEWRISGRTLL